MRDLLSIGMVCPYDWDSPGGVKSHVVGLTARLRELGHTVSIFAPTQDDSATEVVSAGNSVPIPFNGSVSRVKFDPVAFRRAQVWLRDNDFDVLHLHEPLSVSISPIVAWTASGPIVATQHAAYDKSVAVRSGSFLAHSVLERCTVRLAVSDLARRSVLENIGGDALIIPNGIDVEFFSNSSIERFADADEIQILFIGRIEDERKGLLELLEAFAIVAADAEKLKLVVVGPGDQPEEFDQLSDSVKSKIIFTGAVSEDTKAALLKGSDFFIAPNQSGESFGIILTEAMSAGTPILASNIEAFSLVLEDGAAGLLFEPSVEGITQALLRICQNPNLLSAKSRYASELVWQYDWDLVTARVLDSYDQARLAGERVTEDLKSLFLGRWGRSFKAWS